MNQRWLADLGLAADRGWLRDPWLYAAAFAAVPVTLVLRALIGESSDPPVWSGLLLLSFIVWQPAVEELLFRGLIQGQLLTTSRGRSQTLGISGANLATSLLFVIVHMVNHPLHWALAVLAPSLAFGFMRDRHASIWPGLALHCAYNAVFLLAGLT